MFENRNWNLNYHLAQRKPFWRMFSVLNASRFSIGAKIIIMHHVILRLCFAQNSTHIPPQPPFKPDLAPCDFCLFSKPKRQMRGRRCDTIEEIETESQKVLNAITKKDYSDCFKKKQVKALTKVGFIRRRLLWRRWNMIWSTTKRIYILRTNSPWFLINVVFCGFLN